MRATRVSTLITGAIMNAGFALAQTPATIGPAGDAARGQAIYEGKGNCGSCHRIKGVGSRIGPDLSEVGTRTPVQLSTKLTNPDAEILAANRPYHVVLKNGTQVNGRLLNIDTFTIQMIDDKENLRSFVKTDLREFNFVTKSPMPSYQGKLSDQEIADVVAYLGTLRAPGAGRGGRGGAGAGAPPAGAAVGGRGAAAPAQEPH
jgi:putative heme-binding domain-containing protein